MNELSYDPEIAAALLKLTEVLGPQSDARASRGDWAAMRRGSEEAMALLGAMVPPVQDVDCITFSVAAPDGAQIELRWYTKIGSSPGSAVLHLHGGGMIAGSVELYEPF